MIINLSKKRRNNKLNRNKNKNNNNNNKNNKIKEDNIIIVHQKKILTNMLSQGIGLMFHKKINDIGYVFEFKKESIIPLTMMFVFFSIDVLFLNNEKRVVEIRENFKPFANYFPKNVAKYVVELPKGVVGEKKIKVGDRLNF